MSTNSAARTIFQQMHLIQTQKAGRRLILTETLKD